MRAADIAKAHGGKRSGNGYSICCPCHDDHDPSLTIMDGENGKLVVHCFAGCDPRDVLAKLRAFEPSDYQRPHSHNSFKLSKPVQHNDAWRENLAREIWRETISPLGTPVEPYLREVRGYAEAIPPTIRFHRSLPHSWSGQSLPAMVSAIAIAPRFRVCGVQRLWLLPDGMGKARVKPPRATFGTLKTGAIRLSEAGPKMAITEGVETGLSVMLATGLPVWAAISATNMNDLILPPLPLAEEIVICADHDEKGTGQKWAAKAGDRFVADGRTVRICMPPQPGTDFNDLHKEGAI